MEKMSEQFSKEVFEACAPELEAALYEKSKDAQARFAAAILPVCQRHGRPDGDAVWLARSFMKYVLNTLANAAIFTVLVGNGRASHEEVPPSLN